MIRNAPAVLTLIRNRLNHSSSYEEKMLWFHEKGITLTKQDEDLFFLKADKRGHTSNLSPVCNGTIFRGLNLVCYPGPEVEEKTLTQAREDGSVLWHEKKTIFIQPIQGRKLSMYWDTKKEDWFFSDNKKPISSYHNLVRDRVYNILDTAEPMFTYNIVFDDTTIYLIEMWNNRLIRRATYDVVRSHAMRMGFKVPDLYLFEGFDKLEREDFPLEVLDKTDTKFLLREM